MVQQVHLLQNLLIHNNLNHLSSLKTTNINKISSSSRTCNHSLMGIHRMMEFVRLMSPSMTIILFILWKMLENFNKMIILTAILQHLLQSHRISLTQMSSLEMMCLSHSSNKMLNNLSLEMFHTTITWLKSLGNHLRVSNLFSILKFLTKVLSNQK